MKSQSSPTRRFWSEPTEVVAFACSLSMITYLDRVCFGAAAPLVSADLGLSGVADLKWAFTAFTISYAIFEVPTGWLGDTFGPRKTLIRIVLWWSLFTALTGLVGLKVAGITLGGLGTLCLVRFLFGMGEAGAYPNIARALANWMPVEKRGRAQGWVWMSGRLMGGLTPLVWLLLVAGIGTYAPPLHWRGAFLVFGLIGIVWCVFFALRFRDRPPRPVESSTDMPTDTPLGYEHAQVPWRKLFTNFNLLTLCVMYACMSYGWYFNITYFPSFLETQHHVSPQSFLGSIYKGGPLLFGSVGCLIGGFWTDRILRGSGNRVLARRIPGILGQLLCTLCYIGAAFAPNAFWVFLFISLAAFGNDLMMGATWATVQDIGGRFTAITAGCMNTMGNLGGAVSGWVIGTTLQNSLLHQAQSAGVKVSELSTSDRFVALDTGYKWCLYSFVVTGTIAVLCWLSINPNKRLTEER
jgi:ACS family glucarate transporter-like MFS transporter